MAVDEAVALRGEEGKSFVGIIVDPVVMGEAITAPHIRTPPLNAGVVKALEYPS